MIRASTLSGAGPLLSAADLPVQPLTEREVIVLVQSWKAIQKQFVESGVSMFLRYLDRYAYLPRPGLLHGRHHMIRFAIRIYQHALECFISIYRTAH